MTRRVPSPADPEPIQGDTSAVGRDLVRRSREAGFSAVVIEPDGGVWRVTLAPTAVRIGDLTPPSASASPQSPPAAIPTTGMDQIFERIRTARAILADLDPPP